MVLPDDGVPRTRTTCCSSNISASLITVCVLWQIPSSAICFGCEEVSDGVSTSSACCLFPVTLLACCLRGVHKLTLYTGDPSSRDLPRQFREPLANPNRQLAFIFEELHIASMIHEDITVDKCRFEFLKIIASKQFRSHFFDPREQLVLIPLSYLLDCGLCVTGLFGVMFWRGVHGG